ncbi:MAG: hypothetical protein ACPG80_01345 [Rickettsiales bacterium]
MDNPQDTEKLPEDQVVIDAAKKGTPGGPQARKQLADSNHVKAARHLWERLDSSESVREDMNLIRKYLGMAGEGYAALGDGSQSEKEMRDQFMERGSAASQSEELASMAEKVREALAYGNGLRPPGRERGAAVGQFTQNEQMRDAARGQDGPSAPKR